MKKQQQTPEQRANDIRLPLAKAIEEYIVVIADMTDFQLESDQWRLAELSKSIEWQRRIKAVVSEAFSEAAEIQRQTDGADSKK